MKLVMGEGRGGQVGDTVYEGMTGLRTGRDKARELVSKSSVLSSRTLTYRIMSTVHDNVGDVRWKW